MAIANNDNLQLQGQLNGLIYYQIRGSDKTYVRKRPPRLKGGAHQKPRAIRTKENSNEYGCCSKACSLLQHALGKPRKHINKPFLFSQLISTAVPLLHNSSDGIRGQRPFRWDAILPNFQLREWSAGEPIFPWLTSLGQFHLNGWDLYPGEANWLAYPNLPEEATHMRIIFRRGVVCDLVVQGQDLRYSYADKDFSHQSIDCSQIIDLTPGAAHPLQWALPPAVSLPNFHHYVCGISVEPGELVNHQFKPAISGSGFYFLAIES